jgi:hypothetical protein
MSTKQIKGVIVPRHDTAINWAQAKSFIPRDGELIVYTADSDGITYDETVTVNGVVCPVQSSTTTRYKFGNGVDNVNVLPFVTDDIQDYIDSQALHRTTHVDTKSTQLSVPNGDTSVSVALRPTTNLYNFDDTVVPNVNTRVHTSQFLRKSDFESVTLYDGFKAKLFLYNSNYSQIGVSGDFVEGEITVPMSMLGSATYFRVLLGYPDDSVLTSAEATYYLPLDFKLSAQSTLQGYPTTEPLTYYQ